MIDAGRRRVDPSFFIHTSTVDLRPGTWKTLNLLVSGLHRLVQGVDSDPLRVVFSYKCRTKGGSWARKTVPRAHFCTVRTAEEVHVSL